MAYTPGGLSGRQPGLDVDKDLPNDWYLEARRYSGAECLLRLTGARRQSHLTETLIREDECRIGRAITLTITIERQRAAPIDRPLWAACIAGLRCRFAGGTCG